MTRDLLEDLEIIRAATPGPWGHWEFNGNDMDGNGLWITTNVDAGWIVICSFGVNPTEQDRANAHFIAEARLGWPEAVTRALEAEARVAEAVSFLERECRGCDGIRSPENCVPEKHGDACHVRNAWMALRRERSVSGFGPA